MPGKAITKGTIKKNTIADMKKLGTYRPEYNAVIDIYCELREQYECLTKVFKDSGYKKYATATADGGDKKSSLISTLESLRKDIANYSILLGLNPKALESITAEKKAVVSKLNKALHEI